MTPDDDMEDIYFVLLRVRDSFLSITAVSSGAIASDYQQRLRVERVYLFKVRSCCFFCARKQDQTLLQSLFHLGKDLAFMEPHLLKLKELILEVMFAVKEEKYETLTLDCPLMLDEF